MAGLVQQQEVAGTHRKYLLREIGTGILLNSRKPGHGGLTQTNEPPEIPGRFTIKLSVTPFGIPKQVLIDGYALVGHPQMFLKFRYFLFEISRWTLFQLPGQGPRINSQLPGKLY